MIYLASPFYHPEPGVMAKRSTEITIVTKALMARGLPVFCPIAYGTAFSKIKSSPISEDGWRKWDLSILAASSMLMVAQQEGWEMSKGVRIEINFARDFGLPITYLTRDEIANIIAASKA